MTNRPVLICYDDTPEAQRAVETAAALFGPRSAVVLNVGSVLTVSESIAVSEATVSVSEFMALNESSAKEIADTGAERALELGFEATSRSLLGEPTWQSINDVAADIDAWVIVMGTRGLHGAKEFFEGSVSHGVAQHASCPVLVVPPEA